MQEIKIKKVGGSWNTYTVDRAGHVVFKNLVATSKTKREAENWTDSQDRKAKVK